MEKQDLEKEIITLRKLKEEENKHTSSQVTKTELETVLGEVRERQRLELEKIRLYFEEEHRKKTNDVQVMMTELETEYSQRLEEERVARMLAEADIRDVKSTLEEQMKYSKRMEIEIEKLEQRIAIARTEKIMLERGSIPASLLREEKPPEKLPEKSASVKDILFEKKFPPVLQRAVSVKDRKNFFEEKATTNLPPPVIKRYPSNTDVQVPGLKKSPSQSDNQKGKTNFSTLTIPTGILKEPDSLGVPTKLESPRKVSLGEKKT